MKITERLFYYCVPIKYNFCIDMKYEMIKI